MASTIRGGDNFDSGTVGSTTLGDVGTYAWLGRNTTGAIDEGSTYAGSGLKYAGTGSTNAYNDNTAATVYGSAPSGTWRAMGDAFPTTRVCTTLFVRIS